MSNINITRISSKGQIVIPVDMRADFSEGEELLILKDEDRIILKKTSAISKQMKDDIKFAKRTEEAWKRYDEGKFKEMNFDTFINEVKKW